MKLLDIMRKPLTRTITYNGPDSLSSDDSFLSKIQPVAQAASVSMYNPHPSQTDADPFTMASGKKVYDGAIATGDRTIPLGSLVELNNRRYTVEDRMNKRYDQPSQFIDLVNPDPNGAGASRQFGRKQLPFKIVGHDGRSSTKSTTALNDPNQLDMRDIRAAAIKGYLK